MVKFSLMSQNRPINGSNRGSMISMNTQSVSNAGKDNAPLKQKIEPSKPLESKIIRKENIELKIQDQDRIFHLDDNSTKNHFTILK